MSPIVIERIIRGQIGFDGFLMSDDTDMKALSGTAGEKAAAAVAAGCDAALDCWARMDEMIAILRGLAGGGFFAYRGKHYDLPSVKICPVPTRPIPILIGGHADPALRRAARLAQLERAVGVLGEEHALYGNFLRTVLGDEFGDARMDEPQAVGQRSARGGDAPLRDDGQALAVAIDDAVTGTQRARVEAEDACLAR